MKKLSIIITLFVLLIGSAISFSHMGKDQGEKESTESKQHSDMKKHEDKMKVLHHSMALLGGHTDKIFHSIIDSNFSHLSESAEAIKKVAEGLEGTKPHKHLQNIDRYNSLVMELLNESETFERVVDRQDPIKVAEHFGRVIAICVECHINFRD